MRFKKLISQDIIWGGLTFMLSLLSSSLAGRSLWCDEIIRISAQKNYTIAQLFSGDALKAFDSQSPVGYLILRPMQSLLGIEGGGYLITAISAGLVIILTLKIFRLLIGGIPHWTICAAVAINPIVIWFGSDLWMYEMFAAAFSWWLYELLVWDDSDKGTKWLLKAVAVTVSGYLTVALHFSGAFIFAIVGVVAIVTVWQRHRFESALRLGSLLAVSLAANIPMYLSAQNAAGHLVKNTFDFGALSRIFRFLWDYVITFVSSLTGAGWLGVILLIIGIFVLFRKRQYGSTLLLLSAMLAELIYQFYISLRGYSFPAVRFWVYAATPAMIFVGCGLVALFKTMPRIAVLTGTMAVGLNAIGVLNLLTMDGRTAPYRAFADVLNDAGKPTALICPNHYDTRFFTITEYLKPSGSYCLFPSYWEQGETARIQGLALIRKLSPLSPLFLDNRDQVNWAQSAGYASTNVLSEARTPFFRLASSLRVFPEVNTAKNHLSRLLLPLETELFAEAEATGKPVFVPGRGWRISSMPPRKADQPFTPVLTLAPGKRAELKVYAPASFGRSRLTLTGYLGHGRSAASPYSVQFDAAKKGGYVSAIVEGGKDGCYFLYPQIN